jgi:threonine/homoserine/homoserine lactone efflux protein
MTLVWLSVYSVVVTKAGALLRRARVRRTIELVTGTVLVALGLRLATERPCSLSQSSVWARWAVA